MITIKSEQKYIFWQNHETDSLLFESLNFENVSITSTDTVFGFLSMITQKGITQLNVLKNCGKRRRPYLS